MLSTGSKCEMYYTVLPYRNPFPLAPKMQDTPNTRSAASMVGATLNTSISGMPYAVEKVTVFHRIILVILLCYEF